jgi:single-strand DNA-binding protein
MNVTLLIGRLTRDPELRYTPDGTPVASFTLAVDRNFKNGQGERETDFIDCVAWRKLAEIVGEHARKGRLVGVHGRLQIRSYDDGKGVRRRAAEIIASQVRFLDSPRREQEHREPEQGREPRQPEPATAEGADDEGVPF